MTIYELLGGGRLLVATLGQAHLFCSCKINHTSTSYRVAIAESEVNQPPHKVCNHRKMQTVTLPLLMLLCSYANNFAHYILSI